MAGAAAAERSSHSTAENIGTGSDAATADQAAAAAAHRYPAPTVS